MIRVPLQGAELRAFLDEVRLAHWATVGPDGSPRVRPVWYLFEDDAFWFTTRLEARRTGALKEADRAVLRLLPEKLLAWHYGKGDYARLQGQGSLRVELS